MGGVCSRQGGRNTGYADVDKHARNAPAHAKRSVQTLVQYLTNEFKDPKLKVRAFFVWISENIRYDADGYFGRSQRLPGDAESVLRLGRSVCEGYANLMEALCKQADIPVQTITGFSKGYSYSPDKPYTTESRTNHAWTAVKLKDTWHLIDATWGAGHMDDSGKFNKKFNEFYFLTSPKHFVNNHFPYMDNDMAASSKSQFLKNPVTLQQFNDGVCIKPEAFRLGVAPKSHQKAIIKMKRGATLTFTKPKGNTYHFSSTLMFKSGNTLREVQRSTFDTVTATSFSVRLHPRSTGSHVLRIFGNEGKENNKSMAQLFEYVVQCSEVKNPEFEFPYAFNQCQTDKCVLVAPTKYHLKANSKVAFHLKSPLLQKVMVDQTQLKKSGSSFKGKIDVGSSGRTLSVYGSTEANSNKLNGLYRFEVK